MSLGATFAILITATTLQTSPKAPPPRIQDSVVPPVVKLPPPDQAAAVANAPLTADEAARIALKLQPTILAATSAIQTARGQVKQLAAGLNPQLGVYAGYDKLNSLSGNGYTPPEEPTAGAVPGLAAVFPYSSALQLKQLVYDFDQTRNLVRQSKALESVAETNLAQVQKDLVFAVKDAFYTYANSVRLVHVDEQDVANRQRQLDLADARLRHEIGLPSDVVVAETSKSQAILALNVARDEADQNREALLNLMGVDPLTPIAVEEPSEPAMRASDPKGLIDEALRLRPEIQSAMRSVSASKYGLEAAKALGLPSIYAEATVGAAGYSIPLKDNASSLGIGLQFNLFDGGARAGAMESARGQIGTAISHLQSATLAVRNDVASAYLDLQSSQQRVDLAMQEVANASEGVRIAEGRYSAGLGLFQDITTAEGLLITALSDQANAEASVNEARTRIRHAVGEVFS